MKLDFYKYQAAGNDFVLINHIERQLLDKNDHELILRLCDRRFGVGGDGLMIIEAAEDADFRMAYFNADGHPGSMCGNGGRAIVHLAHHLGIAGDVGKFIASDGYHPFSISDAIVSVGLKDCTWPISQGGHYFVDTGSPHAIVIVPDVQSYDVEAEGFSLRHADIYAPSGANVNFMSIDGKSLYVRTFERGVEAETLSCGTGVTACAILAAFLDLPIDREQGISIKTRGGDLKVIFDICEAGCANVRLVGPAQLVFEGVVEV